MLGRMDEMDGETDERKSLEDEKLMLIFALWKKATGELVSSSWGTVCSASGVSCSEFQSSTTRPPSNKTRVSRRK